MNAAKRLSDAPKKAVVECFGEVGDLNLRRIPAPAGSSYRDERNSAFLAHDDHECLLRGVVDGVDDVVIGSRQETLCISFGEEVVDFMDPNLRVDFAKTLSHHTNLCFAHFAFHGGKLAVRVGYANVIHVDQGQSSNP